jgi:hypothetical protein
MQPVTIALKSPLQGHDGAIKQITLRPPGYVDVMTLGEPYVLVKTKGEAMYALESPDVISAYIERCADVNPLLLAQASFEDALALKQAMLGFFAQARGENTGTSPT